MHKEKGLKLLFGYIWQIPISAFVFAFGLIASRLIFYSLGLVMPRMPQQADESIAIYYLLSGCLIITLGLFPLIQKISGTYFTRFLILFVFFYFSFGISTSIESSIYSSVEGFNLMMLILLLPILLFSLVCTMLTKSQPLSSTLLEKTSEFFKTNSFLNWVWRLLLVVVSFPLIYFAFGIVVSPFVIDYYKESGYGLAIPGVGVIIGIQLLRSLLFLIATLPIIIVWTGKKVQFVFFLGLAHFVFVFAYDIVLAYQMPVFLVLTHGVEILLDSMMYSWVLVKLLLPEESK